MVAICDDLLTVEQQLYVLHVAAKHQDMNLRSASTSAGIVSSSIKSVDEQVVTNSCDTIELTRTTGSMYGRTCDDN